VEKNREILEISQKCIFFIHFPILELKKADLLAQLEVGTEVRISGQTVWLWDLRAVRLEHVRPSKQDARSAFG